MMIKNNFFSRRIRQTLEDKQHILYARWTQRKRIIESRSVKYELKTIYFNWLVYRTYFSVLSREKKR